MESEKSTFTYTYSAKQQEEIGNILKKYKPVVEDKMEQLRRLDQSVTRKGRVISLSFGVLSSLIYDTRELVETARYFGVSLTVFLTAVMAEAILEMRNHHADPKMSAQPLQIMIPVNLRKRFPSKTLRNFSLYALPCIMPIHQEMPFEKLIDSIVVQLKEQLSKNHLAAMISTNVTLQKLPLFCFLPLSVKTRLLRIGFHFCGERNSCLSLSNLGEITYPPELRKYVHHIDFSLTPRRNAPYNCGIASFNGKLAISFSKKSDEKGLEWYFFHRLAELGYHSEMDLENCS